MSKRLFDLSEEILDLEARLDNDDLTDEQRQQLVDAWLEAQGDVEAKLDNYAEFIQELEARADARAARARQLVALANADSNKAQDLRERLKLYFQRHKLKRFETARHRITHVGHGGKRGLLIPSAWDDDPANAPEQFQRHTVVLDREALRAVVEEFYAKAERETAEAKNDEERRRLFKDWLERDEAARNIKELIEGCELAERGTSIRIR